MGADVSRVRFDPQRDFSGVELQQGRVLLDADFNEQVAIADRRLRAAVVDLFAETAVSRATPKAFTVAVKGLELFVAPGRMYVNGLLAEARERANTTVAGIAIAYRVLMKACRRPEKKSAAPTTAQRL